MAWEELFDRLMFIPDLEVRKEEPLSRHTSFRIGGPAKRMAFPESVQQTEALLELARETGARPLVMGSGTNLLFPDEGLNCLVVNLTKLNRVEAGDTRRFLTGGAADAAGKATGESREVNTLVTAYAGASLRKTAEFAAAQGLTGLEFAHGIPGSIGGGVCMNAGAYGGEMVQVLRGAAVLFPSEGVKFLDNAELCLSYRHSLLTEHPELTVLSALIELSPGDPEKIRAKQRELLDRRKASQPLEFPSAGSTFKRPPGHYAGTMIQEAGLKGFRIGGAQVSEKHGGFVINRGGATFADVTAVIREVQKRVFDRSGVLLEPEVRIVDRPPGEESGGFRE